MKKSLLIFLILVSIFAGKKVQAADSAVVNLIVAGCNNNLMCEPELGEYQDTCPMDCPAAQGGGPPPGGGGTTVSSSSTYPQTSFIFENFTINAATSTAIAKWSTNFPTQSKVGWGSNYDGAGGTISEASFREDHEIELTGLTPGKSYVITVLAVALNGSKNYVAYTFSTLSGIDTTPPLNILNFRAEKSFGNNILLSWDIPYDPDYYGVRITRGPRFYPRDSNEGQLIYEGDRTSALDTSALPNTPYYYSAFSYDRAGNFSSGAVLRYVLIDTTTADKPGPVNVPTDSVPDDSSLFGGTIASTTIPIGSLIFEQEGKKIYPDGDIVQLHTDHEISIYVPETMIPRNTEQILLTITQNGELRSYLMKVIDGGAAKITIPAYTQSGASKFTISFLMRGSEVRSRGTMVIQKAATDTQVSSGGFHLSFLNKILILSALIICFVILALFIRMLSIM